MKNEIKEKALEDVKFIKEIIEKTSSSMLNLSNFFLKCSVLFFCVTVLLVLGSRVPIPGVFISSQSTPSIAVIIFMQCISIIPLLAIIIVPIIIFKKIVKKNPLKGVSKQIMIFWTFILSLIFVSFIAIGFSNILLKIYNPYNINVENNSISYLLSVHLILFAFGLFCIYIFTNMRFPLILGSVYTILSLYLMVIQPPWNEYNILLTPITFLVIGIYFKLLEVKAK